jgi:hypothetical protein
MSTETKNRFLGGASALGILGVTAALLTACPGTLENKSAFTTGVGGGAGCGDVETALIGKRCATANCHDAATASQGLDLTPGSDLASKLVDQPSTLCMGGSLVSSTAPEMSVMYTKVLETNSCGLRMPASGMKFTDAEEQCLLDWITELSTQ